MSFMSKIVFAFCLTLAVMATGLSPAQAADDPRMTPRILGNPNAPVTVDEYVSLTCTHCAEFYTTILPSLEPKYVDNGKVKFILHDFPLDGLSLKAAAIARCMPPDEYFPFVKTLYANQEAWAFSAPDPEARLLQYAKLGGLSADKAKACMTNTDLQNAIIAERTAAADKKIEATPTFLLDGGVETIKGAQTVETFTAAFDRRLAVDRK